jgi:DICT domain-containing protein/predicted DNA-binding transcriptional regulator AlpA
MSDAETLSMSEMSAHTGVSEGTLRMWEARHGFPSPARLPSGHRRYSELEVKRVLSVLEARRQGLSLATAIAHARELGEEPRPSIYAALRDGFPHLQPLVLSKRALVCLSRAIEDEVSARGERPLLFGCFQHERFYRRVESRWKELARTAERTVVLADFRRKRTRARGPSEIPIRESDPLMREWVVVCEAPGFAACLSGFERPRDEGEPRRFETIWSVESQAVRRAAQVCCELSARAAPELVAEIMPRLQGPPAAGRDEARIGLELSARTVAYALT